MDKKAFGEKLRQRRKELRLSQEEVAIALGLDQSKVSLIERGVRTVDGQKDIPILSEILQKPLSWFYEESETLIDDPFEAVMNEYFRGVKFTAIEIKRMKHLMEPVLQQLAKADPSIAQKIEESRGDKNVA